MAQTAKAAQSAPKAQTEQVASTATVAAGSPVSQVPSPASVQPQQYTTGTGWGVGQLAPEDRFLELDPQGNTVGKASKTAPAGKYATQVAIKGQPVTAAVRAALGMD